MACCDEGAVAPDCCCSGLEGEISGYPGAGGADVGTAGLDCTALCDPDCDSAACCAVALIETSSATVNIHFVVRMTLVSIFLKPFL